MKILHTVSTFLLQIMLCANFSFLINHEIYLQFLSENSFYIIFPVYYICVPYKCSIPAGTITLLSLVVMFGGGAHFSSM